MKDWLKGKKFSSTYQPANRGRKPDILKKLKGCGCSENDIKKILESIIFLDSENSQKILEDSGLPLIALGYVRALIQEINIGKIDVLEKILDRLYGKPSQKQDLNANIIGSRPVIMFSGDDADEGEKEDTGDGR